jgi:hypothetical protein
MDWSNTPLLKNPTRKPDSIMARDERETAVHNKTMLYKKKQLSRKLVLKVCDGGRLAKYYVAGNYPSSCLYLKTLSSLFSILHFYDDGVQHS